MLSAQPTDSTFAKLDGVNTCLDLANNGEVADQIDSFIKDYGLKKEDIDLVIFGMDGDIHLDQIYHQLQDTYFDRSSVYGYYKHLCGEYYTSTAFALWLGSIIIRNQAVPAIVRLNTANRQNIRHVLIYNHIRNKEHSMILLSAPD
jgi:hypothetical protein